MLKHDPPLSLQGVVIMLLQLAWALDVDTLMVQHIRDPEVLNSGHHNPDYIKANHILPNQPTSQAPTIMAQKLLQAGLSMGMSAVSGVHSSKSTPVAEDYNGLKHVI